MKRETKGNNGGGSLLNCKAKVTPPLSPPQYLRVTWRRALQSSILSVQLTGEQLKWQPCLGRLYIHSHSHTHTGYTLVSTLLPTVVRFPPISLLPYMEGLTEVSTQSPDAQTKRIGSPLGWPPLKQRLAYLYPALSRGPFRADGWPLLGPAVARCLCVGCRPTWQLIQGPVKHMIDTSPPISTNVHTRFGKLPQNPDRPPNRCLPVRFCALPQTNTHSFDPESISGFDD